MLTLSSTSSSGVPGTSATTVATITPKDGFTGAVSFSLVSPPAGVTLTGGSVIVGGSAAVNADLTVALADTTAPGAYTLTIQATSGSLSFSMPYTLNVSPISGSQVWARQFGTRDNESINGISVASDGSVYVGGFSTGTFPNSLNIGGQGAFLARFDASGTQTWLTQFGTLAADKANSVVAEPDGSAYVGGLTLEISSGSAYQKGFLAKYDPKGIQVWLTKFGTGGDTVTGIALAPDGSLYAAGYTNSSFPGYVVAGGEDMFLAKFDPSGNQLWVRQLGTPQYDRLYSVAASSDGSIYIAGNTLGSFPGFSNLGANDFFLAKYDAGGNAVWLKQYGATGDDHLTGLAIGSDGSIYAAGFTNSPIAGDANQVNFRTYLSRTDKDGNLIWAKKFAVGVNDFPNSISAAPDGAVYVGGYSYITGTATDAFLAKFDGSGANSWLRVISTSGDDSINGISLAPDGSLYAGGYTTKALPGNTSAGSTDAFLVKYTH